MKVAIFDFDGTILEGNSWQLLFWDCYASSWRNRILLGGYLGVRKAGLITASQLKERVLQRFRGWDAATVSAWSNAFHQRELVPRLRPRALAELARVRVDGFVPVLATGAFDFLVAPFARDHGIEFVASTRVAVEDGCFTGSIDGPECRGTAKLGAVREVLRDVSFNPDESCAYSDNEDDVPLLRAFGSGTFVATHRPRFLPEGVRIESWSS